jgi:hypothetical protein
MVCEGEGAYKKAGIAGIYREINASSQLFHIFLILPMYFQSTYIIRFSGYQISIEFHWYVINFSQWNEVAIDDWIEKDRGRVAWHRRV